MTLQPADVVDTLTCLSGRAKRWSPAAVKRALESGRIVSAVAFVKEAPCLTLLAADVHDWPHQRMCRCRRRRGDWRCVVARFSAGSSCER